MALALKEWVLQQAASYTEYAVAEVYVAISQLHLHLSKAVPREKLNISVIYRKQERKGKTKLHTAFRKSWGRAFEADKTLPKLQMPENEEGSASFDNLRKVSHCSPRCTLPFD